ncbi:hypothetical protein K2173_008523 [Erythroxylum novogranatense]|uniref:Stress response NST1-like protein n=1 Tax=Erythroxylum novogranatense TaxID=1862640 RepID=A0AAV8SKR8_9ROSI|nr:hypothetical protein K2173_008523 [Erythroxylum novogranatense]
MESIPCNKVQPVVRKVKKKQMKGELDHLKRAEKKKRRLEKALAASAAIRSELEKKKKKKMEEQQRLDEEGAAIAEAVALHVLLGEDSDDSCNFALNKEVFTSWNCNNEIELVMAEEKACLPYWGCTRSSLERIGYGADRKWDDIQNGDWSFSYGSFRKDLHSPYFDGGSCGTTEFSAGLIAAQAVSSLKIAEEACADAIVFN